MYWHTGWYEWNGTKYVHKGARWIWNSLVVQLRINQVRVKKANPFSKGDR